MDHTVAERNKEKGTFCVKSDIDFSCIVFIAHLSAFTGHSASPTSSSSWMWSWYILTWDQAGTKIKECPEFQVSLRTCRGIVLSCVLL